MKSDVANIVQAQSLPSELVTKVLGAGVSVGPIVTIEPRRRKFHKPITVTLPLPWELQSAATKYSVGNLRLLCSIAGISCLLLITDVGAEALAIASVT